jgi:hypothetical protein
MSDKRILIQECKTGLIRRYGYYRTKTGVACAKALLEKYGWTTGRIRQAELTGEFYLFARHYYPHKPANTSHNGIITINLGRRVK